MISTTGQDSEFPPMEQKGKPHSSVTDSEAGFYLSELQGHGLYDFENPKSCNFECITQNPSTKNGQTHNP